jgi:4-diphosphocytidyl-2-C-methyl-D-erythritol kinase
MSTREVSTLRILAPAKINWSLHVRGRRPDGYHDIESLFLPISLADEVTVALEDGIAGTVRLRSDDPALPADSRNLAVRAVEEYYRGRGDRPGVAIELRKRIPAGSGLGGGSSDAAAVLRALSRFDGRPETGAELEGAARRVGADVPFFLCCRPARVTGIGERIEPLDGVPRHALVVAFPGFAVSTRLAYEELDRERDAPSTSSTSLTSSWDAVTIQRFRSRDPDLAQIHNDFEEIVGRRHPQIAALKRRLALLGASGAAMSGSGSAVFGVFPDPREAEQAAETIRSEGVWAASVTTLDGPPPVEAP